MATKSAPEDTPAAEPESTTLDPEQNQPQPEPEPVSAPPSWLTESADLIPSNRAAIAAKQKQVLHLQAEINTLQGEVDALNSLRQIRGQAPL